jgi:DNA invertase Pin-like site-specific DNA recombinase
MRTGIQSLMRDAATRKFDIVLAEALDRFSRDQEDVARLFKLMTFVSVKIVTLSEGEITPLHIGLKGTMNALYLKDLADKTRRGLRGRVEAGRSGGGISYGYRVVRVLDGQPRGNREIDPDQAAIVRRIFRAFAEGMSPKAIAKALNAEAIPGPSGATWSPSTIHGNPKRGIGILNNELYVGRLVWNRQHFMKDSDTGKRQARPNPPSEWVSKQVEDLRIIDEAIWQAAKGRQQSTRSLIGRGIVRARRPKYLFSGLTRCGECGGGFTLSSHDLLTCFNAHERGTCTNRRSIKRQQVEARVLRAMRERFFEPAAFDAFCKGFTKEMEERRREHVQQLAGARRELAAVERRQRAILNALAEGYRSEAWKAELETLDDRKAGLTAALTEPPLPALHPNMAEVFRRNVLTLAEGL